MVYVSWYEYPEGHDFVYKMCKMCSTPSVLCASALDIVNESIERGGQDGDKREAEGRPQQPTIHSVLISAPVARRQRAWNVVDYNSTVVQYTQ